MTSIDQGSVSRAGAVIGPRGVDRRRAADEHRPGNHPAAVPVLSIVGGPLGAKLRSYCLRSMRLPESCRYEP